MKVNSPAIGFKTGLLSVLLLLSISPLGLTSEIDDKQPLPDIRWQDVDGKTHHLKDSHGKPRLLHFWAAWCIPCRKEMPEMLTWQAENPDILVIPLSLDQRMAQTKHFIKKNKLDMPAFLVNEDDRDALSIPAVPYTIFVSSDGLFSGDLYGIAPWEDDAFTKSVHQQLKLK